MKAIPHREAALFARTWGGLLFDATQKKDPESWFDFFTFPKCVLAPPRAGRRFSKQQSQADLVHERLLLWTDKSGRIYGRPFLPGKKDGVKRARVIPTREGAFEK